MEIGMRGIGIPERRGNAWILKKNKEMKNTKSKIILTMIYLFYNKLSLYIYKHLLRILRIFIVLRPNYSLFKDLRIHYRKMNFNLKCREILDFIESIIVLNTLRFNIIIRPFNEIPRTIRTFCKPNGLLYIP